VEGKAIAIGETHWLPYKSETGEEGKVFMCKRQGKDDEWCFEAGGKVYLKKSDGNITQIAWIGWPRWQVVH